MASSSSSSSSSGSGSGSGGLSVPSAASNALLRRAQHVRSPFRSDCLKGHVALITGGGSGIGFEIARQLGLHGASVVLMGRRQAVLESAVSSLAGEGISGACVRGDVRSLEDAQRAVSETLARFGSLSVLVNSAAGNFLAAAEDLAPKGFRTVMDIDALGVFTMCQAAFAPLKQRGDGCIINISAMLHQPATWFQVHASAAKAAIDSVTRSLALEWGEYGIRVVGLAPGPVAGTAGMDKLAAGVDADTLAESIPLRRWASTTDMGLSCVFLASDAGVNITGEVLVNDGGSWLWKPSLASRDMIREFSRAKEKKQKEKPVGIASKL